MLKLAIRRQAYMLSVNGLISADPLSKNDSEFDVMFVFLRNR